MHRWIAIAGVALGAALSSACAVGADESPFGPAATIGAQGDDDRGEPWDGDDADTGEPGGGSFGSDDDAAGSDGVDPGEPPPPLDAGDPDEPPPDETTGGVDDPADDPTDDPTDPPPDPPDDPPDDPPPPDEPWYDACDASCTAPMTCLGTGYGTFCSGYCAAAGDPSACGLAPAGTASPICVETGSGQPACALDCSTGATCPTGMSCHTLQQSTGPVAICT